MASMMADPVSNYTNTRSSQINQANCTHDFSYPFVSSTSFSSSSPISLFLGHNSNVITEHKVKSSLSISPCHDSELTPSSAYTEFSIHRVQHTPSSAYTEYSIHLVQHTPCTAYTEYTIHRVQHPPKIVFLPLILMITSWLLNVTSTSAVPPYMFDCRQPAHHQSSKILWACHIPTIASELTAE